MARRTLQQVVSSFGKSEVNPKKAKSGKWKNFAALPVWVFKLFEIFVVCFEFVLRQSRSRNNARRCSVGSLVTLKGEGFFRA
jgi:hypothetical protein